MYIHKRLKISKSTAKTFLFPLAAAFVAGLVWLGCGDEGGSLAPESDQLVALAPGGGTETGTFTAELVGDDVSGISGPTTQEIKQNTKWINFRNMPLDLSFLHDGGVCFPDGVVESILMVTKLERGPHPPGAWFWFKGSGTDGEEVTYVLLMPGAFPPNGSWPPPAPPPGQLPGPENSITITLDGSWEMETEGNKNKTACTGEGEFTGETKVIVTRIE